MPPDRSPLAQAMELERALDAVRSVRGGVLVTLKRDGRPSCRTSATQSMTRA